MPFDGEQAKGVLGGLATSGVLIGTSSSKHDGWFGQPYTPGRYEYRGKVAKTRFERGCLSEYAEIFKTVCVDGAFRHNRDETERFNPFGYDGLVKRDEVNFDIFWLKDDALEESANLPAPEIIAQEITDDLEAALEQFATITEDRGVGR